jgi:hypothetical protein
MPLNKSLRNEEKERINAVLKKLTELIHIPNFATLEMDEQLKSLGLTTRVLLKFSGKELVEHLEKLHFDWENAEKFADFLVLLSEKLVEEKSNLLEKVLLIYNYIQDESKTFSFEIFGKIGVVKGRL